MWNKDQTKNQPHYQDQKELFNPKQRNLIHRQHSSVESPWNKTLLAAVKPCIYCNIISHALEECKNMRKLLLEGRYEWWIRQNSVSPVLNLNIWKVLVSINQIYLTVKGVIHQSFTWILDKARNVEHQPLVRTDQNNNSFPISSASLSSTTHMGTWNHTRQAQLDWSRRIVISLWLLTYS